MRRSLGRWIQGFVAGWLLSRLRAQAGGDLLDWPMPYVGSAALERAAAMGILAIGFGNARRSPAWTTLLAIPAGYAVHGLLLGPPASPSFLEFVFLALVALVGLALASGAREPDEDDPDARPANVGEKIGLACAGAGVAVAFESVARHLRLFGAGLAQDDSVFGTTLLALVAFGALAFGWIVRAKSLRRLAFPVLLAASAAACFLALRLIEGLSTNRGLDDFMRRRFGLDGSYHGTIGWDALLAARVFVLPGLVLGASLGGISGKRCLASALGGAAIGLAVFPRFLDPGSNRSTGEAQLFSAQFVTLASLVALGGAAFAILSASQRKARARYAALVLVLACGLPALLVTVKPIYVLSPWQPRPVFPYLALETPSGLATVEPSPGGLKVATLDRRLLSPTTTGSVADAQRIRRSIDLLPPERRANPGFRVLFVGQMTALRANELLAAGASTIDRSAAWHAAMKNLEGELFKEQEGKPGLAPPPGEILAPKEALKRLAHGDYDLAIALPIAGDVPVLNRLEAPASTVVVRWFSVDEPLRAGEIPSSTFVDNGARVERRVLLPAGNGLDDLSFGLVTNGTLPVEGDASRPLLLAIDPRSNAPRPIERLSKRESWRVDASRLEIAERLARVASGAQAIALTAGMRSFYAAQVPSSPFETAEQRIELDEPTLTSLEQAALVAPLDPFTRQTWEWLAWVLVGKRDIAAIDRHVAPIAARYAPWTTLEIALARADIEGLEARSAIDRLTPILQAEPRNFRLLVCLADAEDAAGDRTAAITAWRQALVIVPGERGVRRKLAVALCKAGDPEGRTRVLELLAEDPDDAELKDLRDKGASEPGRR